MSRTPPAPLPARHGLAPARMRMPTNRHWDTLRDFLVHRLARLAPDRIDGMLRAGRIYGEHGPLPADAPFVPGSTIWFHRDLPDEAPVPFEIGIVHRDERLVVVDKPHFLATIPRGKHVLETALVRLRRDLELPELSPAHRLDRATAGLVIFVVRPEHRGAYQKLFADRAVGKEYEAVAPFDGSNTSPLTVRNRIIKERGIITARQVPGEPNSETRIELLERRGELARYRLLPATGRTHQLRLHMSDLGLPILGDELYPTVTETPLDDFSNPLQLLARSIRFTDPITGHPREFTSELDLAAWPSSGDQKEPPTQWNEV